MHLAKVYVSSTELLRFGSRRRNYRFKEEMEMRTSSMWPWLARMDNEVGHTRLSCQEEVPLLNLLFIYHGAIPFIGIALYDLQRAAAGKWLQHCPQWA